MAGEEPRDRHRCDQARRLDLPEAPIVPGIRPLHPPTLPAPCSAVTLLPHANPTTAVQYRQGQDVEETRTQQGERGQLYRAVDCRSTAIYAGKLTLSTLARGV